jgi:UDP:flavonoid glycosyltransferase YjiC (YdhE family)
MRVLLCPMSDPGYLYPAIAVGLELRQSGHGVLVLGRTSARMVVTAAGLEFLDATDYHGWGGFSVARWWGQDSGPAQYRAVRRAANEIGAEVLITSVLCHGALLAGEVMDLPQIVLGLAAHLWDYPAGGSGESQTWAVPRERLTRSVLHEYASVRERVGLPVRRDAWPPRPLLGAALLLRGDPVLEYPGAVLPESVTHVGPCAWEPSADRTELDEMRARLDRTGKPVIYVHLGRVFGGTDPWPRLNAAFTHGPYQAVVEQGRSQDPRPDPGADILLVRKPWMGPLIEMSVMVLTNGTSAPVLNALLRGRPLGVSPAGSEQPTLSAACVRAGVAKYIPNELSHCPSDVLGSLWLDDAVRSRARELGLRLARADGERRAADIVQRVVSGRPVAISRA